MKPRAGRPSWYRDQSADFDIETGLLPYDLVRDPRHSTNASLRRAYERRAPLIYFRAVKPACYEAIWPVWVEDFRENEGRVLLAAADSARKDVSSVQDERQLTGTDIRERSYSLRMTKHRNHQAWFSSRIRSVYGYQCAFSNFPLGKLLVGAHIKSDEDGGPASVSNGICMSTLHHAAFDTYLVLVRKRRGSKRGLSWKRSCTLSQIRLVGKKADSPRARARRASPGPCVWPRKASIFRHRARALAGL